MSKPAAAFLAILIFFVGLRVGTGVTSLPLGTSMTGTGTVLSDPKHQADISLLWDTWKLLNQTYVSPNDLTSKKLIEGAAAGLVRGIGDPHTMFLSKQEVKDFDDSLNGNLEGIGAELNEKDGYVLVSKPLPNSPAERGGLRAGDVIVKINDEIAEGLSLTQVVKRVRGPEGTTVTLTLLRSGATAPIKLTFTRAKIHIPSVEATTQKTASGTVGVLALHQFGDQSVQEVQTALEGFLKDKVQGVVLDLRGNGGGYLEGAIDITSMFIKEGVVVSVEKRGGEREVHKVNGYAIAPALPLTVLIDGGSASASEITAGALQDHKRATIVGQESFGKGTVQEIYQLSEGASVKVTIARWITPNGRNLGKDVIHPDVVIAPGADPKTDVQLLGAIHQLFVKHK